LLKLNYPIFIFKGHLEEEKGHLEEEKGHLKEEKGHLTLANA